uniref:Major facilitator superfamily (MFS) profile domain-containing protein n=1 Tax=Strigamia maritima TaxID=126957 RepID=T1II10_STRMM
MKNNTKIYKRTTRSFSRERNKTEKNIDGGWAWVVLAVAFCSFAITSSLFYSFGILYSVFLEEFKESRSSTAWIGSLNGAFFQISGPIGSVIIVKRGCRSAVMLGGLICTVGYLFSAFSTHVWHLYIFYGIVVANVEVVKTSRQQFEKETFGFNLVYTGLVVSLGQHFQKRYSLAMGLSMAGSGIGLLTIGPAIQALINKFGWRDMLILDGGLTLHYVIAGALLFPMTDKPLPPAQEVSLIGRCGCSKFSDSLRKSEQKNGKFSVFPTCRKSQICSTYTRGRLIFVDVVTIAVLLYRCLSLSSFFWILGGLTVIIICKDFAVSRGFGDSYILALMALGSGDIVGRLLGGVVASSNRVNIVFYYTMAMIACSSVILNYMSISNATGLILLSTFFGFFYGQQSVLLPLVPVKLYGADKLATTFGFILFTAGFGSLIGPPVAGWIVDKTRSYDGAFSFAGICNLQAAVCMFIIYAIIKFQNNKKTAHYMLLDPENPEESDQLINWTNNDSNNAVIVFNAISYV